MKGARRTRRRPRRSLLCLKGNELAVLLKWRLGPRGGITKLGNVEAKRAKWVELKDQPEPVIGMAPALPPLPHEEVLVRLRARLAATPTKAPPPAAPFTPDAPATAAAPAAAGEATPATALRVAATAETTTPEELDAAFMVISAERARRAAAARAL